MKHRSKRLLDRVRDAIRLKGGAIPSVPKKPTSTGSSASFSSTTNAILKRWATRTSEPFSFTWRRRKALLLPLRIRRSTPCYMTAK